MKKIILTIFSILSVSSVMFLVASNLNFLSEDKNKEEQVENIAEAAWDNYDVTAYQILGEDEGVYFKVADTENKNELRNMLQSNFERIGVDLKNYSITILTESEKKERFGHT